MKQLLKMSMLCFCIICFGACFVQAQNTLRGMYDLIVSTKVANQSTFEINSAWEFDREIMIHEKVNFIFDNFPQQMTTKTFDPNDGSVTSQSDVPVQLFVRFNNQTNNKNWDLVIPSASILKDYSSRLVNGENNFDIDFALAENGVPAVDNNGQLITNQFADLIGSLYFKTVRLVIKQEFTRPYISPNKVIDIETDEVFSPPTGVYAPSTLQSSAFFNPYKLQKVKETLTYFMQTLIILKSLSQSFL